MDAEHFFSRWSRRKAQARHAHQETAGQRNPAAEKRAAPDFAEPPAHEPPPPTMDDAAALTPQSDFRRFLAQGVDPAVRRSAREIRCSDPHFHVMDRLDIYIDDYNRFQPLPDAMLAALNHAQGVLHPQPLFASAPERLVEESGKAEPAPTTDAGSETAAPAPPAAECPEDGGTTAGMPQAQTEQPENGPDHGNPISHL